MHQRTIGSKLEIVLALRSQKVGIEFLRLLQQLLSKLLELRRVGRLSPLLVASGGQAFVHGPQC